MKTKTAAFSAAQITYVDYTKIEQISKVSLKRIKEFDKVNKVLLDNIPNELLQQPRWIEHTEGIPIRKWSNPINQFLPDEKHTAFDLSSHSDEYPEYLMLDWDDVYNPEEDEFTSELAEKVFYWTLANLPVTYVELSKSKTGFHFLVQPTNLPPITNGNYNVLHFTDDSKLEIFYKNKARLAFLTGYSLGENVIAKDKSIDKVILQLLSEIRQSNGYKPPVEDRVEVYTFEQNQIRAQKMLTYIPVTSLDRSTWRTVIRSWKDLKLPFDTIDEWSKPDERYNDGKDADTATTWEEMEPGDPEIAISTLCTLADTYGGYNSKHNWDKRFWKQFQTKLTEKDHVEVIQQFIQSPNELTEHILTSAAYLILTKHTSELIFQFKSACKQIGITLTELNQRLSPIQKKVQKQLTDKLLVQKQNASKRKFNQLGLSCPIDLHKVIFPDNLVPNWSNKTLEQIADTGIIEKFDSITLVTEHLYDPLAEDYYTTLQVLNHLTDEWKAISVPRNYMMSTKMVELSNKGLSVSQWNCKQMSEYLCKFEQLNTDLIANKTLVHQPGWENNKFICPQIPDENYGLTSAMSQSLNKDFSCSGKIIDAINLVQKLKTSLFSNFALGTVLASSLVGIIGCENIHVHMYGKANSGKSVLFNAVFSVLGNPNSPGVIPTSKTSLAGLEFYLAARRDLPAMIDDLNTANNEDVKPILHDLIMGFGNGVGKLRGNIDLVLNHTYQMRGSLLTNAEKMITDEFSNGGSKRRVIEIMVPDVLVDSSLAAEITNVTKQSYGVFFVDWIKYIQGNPSKVIHTYKNNLNWLIEHYPNKVERQLHSVSAIITANQLFSQLFLNTEDSLETYDEILEQLGDFSTMSDTYRVTQIITEWYQTNKHMFIPPTHIPPEPHYGFINKKYVAVYPQIFDELLKSWGFHIATIKQQLQKDGFLQSSSGKNLNVPLILQDGTNVRMVKIYANKLA